MNIEKTEKDRLKDLLQSLPVQEECSENRKRAIMREIRKESVRIHKRKERLSWMAAIFASLFILWLGIKALASLNISLLDIPTISISDATASIISFSVFIALSAFALLLLDYFLRKKYWEHK